MVERICNTLGRSYPTHLNGFLAVRKLVESKRFWQRQRLSTWRAYIAAVAVMIGALLVLMDVAGTISLH